MLAHAIEDRVKAIQYGVTPKGANPPFTRKQSASETLQWWIQHRYDELGMSVVATMTPMQVAQLDAWLAQETAQRSHSIPGVQNVLTRALGAERAMEGPPVGPTVS